MITLHFQYLDGDYDEIMVEETDEQKIKIIHENNNIIRRKKYLKDKYESKFTIEQIERKTGCEFKSNDLEILDKLILIEEEMMLEYAKSLLKEAKQTLSSYQLNIYTLMVEQKYTSSEAALKLNCSPQNVNKILRLAKTKISKFYSNYPKVIEVFPCVLKYLK